jgi:hypothetical protein
MLLQADLVRAVELGFITSEQASAIGTIAGEPRRELPRCPAAVAAALAAAVLLAAGPLAAWIWIGGACLAVAAAAYAALMFAVARRLWCGPLARAGGVLAAAGALAVPCAAAGLLVATGWITPSATAPQSLGQLLAHPHAWVDATAILALGLVAWRLPYPPLGALLAGACWALAMDAASLLFGYAVSWPQRALVSAVLGAATIALGFALDRRAHRELAGWLYLVGLLGVFAGLVTPGSPSAAGLVVGFAIAAALVALGPVTGRPIFAVFGAIALASDAGRLGALALRGPALVAVAALIALGTMVAADAYRVVDRRAGAWLRARLPSTVAALLPTPPLDVPPPRA